MCTCSSERLASEFTLFVGLNLRPSAGGSDESFCAISDEEDPTPLNDLPINAQLAKKHLKRKKGEDDSDDENIDSIIQRTQKHLANRKAEIHIRPGDDFNPRFLRTTLRAML
ncbi:hypothetical protein APHAL10511_004097 [Amanita phalloides]|nr:hypothetical protein APHAL10511_004097 [Amanita phalloides]